MYQIFSVKKMIVMIQKMKMQVLFLYIKNSIASQKSGINRMGKLVILFMKVILNRGIVIDTEVKMEIETTTTSTEIEIKITIGIEIEIEIEVAAKKNMQIQKDIIKEQQVQDIVEDVMIGMVTGILVVVGMMFMTSRITTTTTKTSTNTNINMMRMIITRARTRTCTSIILGVEYINRDLEENHNCKQMKILNVIRIL